MIDDTKESSNREIKIGKLTTIKIKSKNNNTSRMEVANPMRNKLTPVDSKSVEPTTEETYRWIFLVVTSPVKRPFQNHTSTYNVFLATTANAKKLQIKANNNKLKTQLNA